MKVKIEKIRKEINLLFKYENRYDDTGNAYSVGMDNKPKEIDEEIWVQEMPDIVINEANDRVETGRRLYHIGGTRKGYRNLGKLLLALSYYDCPRDDYWTHINIADIEDNPLLHLIIHLPKKKKDRREAFTEIVNLGEAIISTDTDETIDITKSRFRR